MKKINFDKFRKKLSIFAVSIALLFGGVFGGQNLNDFGNNAKAITMTDTTSYVKVGELYDVESQTFNADNLSILKRYMTAYDNDAGADYFISFVDTIDADYMRSMTLNSGVVNGIEYTSKTSSQDIVVRLGGLDWQVMYVSKDKSGNSIITLWLSDNAQEAWADRSTTEGYYYGFLNGGLYSRWAYQTSTSVDELYPATLYGASYINAVTLNNGGVYSRSGSALTTVEKSEDNPFAYFTMEQFGLTEYIVTPRNVAWQENQSAKTAIAQGNNCPNDAWSNSTPDDGFSSPSYNYAGREYNDAWADSYIWLPSASETGSGSDRSGIWKTSDNQRMNYDGSTTTSIGSVGSSSSTTYPYSWTRSGWTNVPFYARMLHTTGAIGNSQTNNSAAVRPALHLNLSAINDILTKTSIKNGEININPTTSEYDGQVKTPEVSVTYNSNPLNENVDYTIQYSLNGEEVSEIKNAGEYAITAIGMGDYIGKKSITYTITPRDINLATIPDPVISKYTGSAITQSLEISDLDSALVLDTDYTVMYTDNTSVGTATMVITGTGNYTGSVTKTFEITPLEISDASITISSISNQTYTASEIKPTPTITLNGGTLVKDTDYTLAYSNNINVGTATITITGIGNFYSTRDVTFTIVTRDISSGGSYGIISLNYTGDPLTPTTTITVNGRKLIIDVDYIATFTNNINAGTGYCTVTGINNYSGSRDMTFTIGRRGISYATISSISIQQYTGSNIVPELNIEYNNHTLVSGTDYTAEYTNNTALGTATITITGIGNFTGTTSTSFNIVAQDISDDTLTLSNDTFIYSGDAVSFVETLSVGSVVLMRDTDYTLAIRKDSVTGTVITEAKDVGTYYLVATGMGNYTGTISAGFVINPRDLSTGTIALSTSSLEYTGSSLIPTYQVKLNSAIVANNYYDIVIKKDGTQTTPIDIGKYTIEAMGKNGYTGTLSVEYNIVARDITDAVITYKSATYTYTGFEIEPIIESITKGDLSINKSDVDVVYSNNIGASNNATITITGKGNYTGTASTKFVINKATIATPLTFIVNGVSSTDGNLSVTYTGGAFTPNIIAQNTSSNSLSASDYIIEYKRNNEITTNLTDAGSVYISVTPKLNTITGTTNLAGNAIGVLTINPINMSSAYVEIKGNYEYNNAPIIPDFDVYTDFTKSTLVDSGVYSYQLSNNTNAGNGNLIVSFTGNYTGTVSQTFEIGRRNISYLSFTYTIPILIYDGTEKTITWEVEDINGADLSEQYSYVYNNNINAGTAKITFTGTNNYIGSIEKTYIISPASIEEMTISTISDQTYTGSEIRPSVEIKIDESHTLDSSNYTESFSSNILVGTASITIVANGNYTGTLSTTFAIVPASITLASIQDISALTFTMLPLTPKPIITYLGATLLENNDYTLSYSNNTNAGTATITISGMTCFTGTTTKEFVINPANVNNIILSGLSSSYTYTGSAIDNLHINNTYFNGMLLETSGSNRLIDVSYTNNTNVGTASITITPYTNTYTNFTGSKTFTFDITKATLTLDMCALSTIYYEYTGASIAPLPTIAFNDISLVKDTDYTLAYPTDTTNVGTKTIIITAVDDGNFDGRLEFKYYIRPKSIAGVTKSSIENQVYTRNSITPSLTIKDGETTLVYNVDYTLEYSNNIDVATATIVIRGKGNYSSTTTTTATFEIIPATINSLTLSSTTKVYDRKSATITASTVMAGSLQVLSNEYTLKYFRGDTETADLISAGDITTKIISTSENFVVAEDVSATFTIIPATISRVSLRQVETIYNADIQTPQVDKVLSSNNLVLTEDEYSINYLRNSEITTDFENSGTVIVKILSNSDNFKIVDNVTCEYRILPKPITDSDISIKYYFVEYDAELGDYRALDLNGDGKRDYMLEDQVYIAYLVHPEIKFVSATSELVKGESFTFTILNTVTDAGIETSTEFVNVGAYVITINAIGNYTGTIQERFKVNTRDFTDENVSVSFRNGRDFAYTGNLIQLDLTQELLVTYYQDGNTYEIVLEGTSETSLFAYKLYDQKTLTFMQDGEEVEVTFDEGNYGYLNNIDAGTAMVFLQGVGNFEGVISVEFNITALSITDSTKFTFELSDTSNIIYTGLMHKPSLATATFNGNDLEEGIDYIISYANNVNASTSAKVIITGRNNFKDTLELTFTIAPKTLQNSMLINIANTYFNGSEQKPNINLIYNSMTLNENTDYEVSYNKNADFVNANDITITISASENGNYTGTITHTYRILPRTLRSIALSAYSGKYSGVAHNITYVIRDMDNLVVSQNTSNMSIKFYLGTDEVERMLNNGVYKIEVVGLNNYTGTVSANYTINKADVGIEMLTDIPNQIYTKAQITPEITMTYLSQEMLFGTDYTYSFTNNVDVGIAEILVSGIGNFSGSFTAYFNIIATNLNTLTFDESIALEAEYTGLVVTPSNDIFTDILKFGEYSLVINQDFVIYTTNNSVNVGTYNLQIKGIGNYTGILIKEFEIIPMDIGSEKIVVSGVVDKTYTGLRISQENLNLSNSISSSLLYLGTDFNLEYVNNQDVAWQDGVETSSAKIVLTAVAGGNYTGSREIYFKILAKSLGDADITVASIPPVVYDGSAQEPKPEVKFKTTILDESIITYSWENNIEYGRASVIITAKDNTNFKGSIIRYFDIGLTDMGDVEVSGIVAELVYNGSEQKQIPVLTSKGTTLIVDTDYTLSYSSDTTNVGTVTVTIQGINNYSGVILRTYEITPIALTQSSVVIADIEDYEFTGSEISPLPVVSYNSNTLTLSRDYVLSYSNNINVTNEAQITISFTGNYSGTATKTFKINPKQLSLSMVSGLTAKTFTGSEIKPDFEIIYNLKNYLDEEGLFDISYRNNTNVGTAYVDIVGKNNFYGTITASFEITTKTLTVSDIILDVEDTYIYTGFKITPTFSVRLTNNKILSAGNDYTFNYGDNINAGNGEVYLEFKGNYAGSVTATFTIEQVDLSSNRNIISNISSEVGYNASTNIPNFSVKYLDYTLNANDYSVAYFREDGESSNLIETTDLVNAGNIIVRLTGKNNFKGTLDLSYKIVKKLLSSEDISVGILSSNLTYAGSEICPEIEVSMGATVLVKDVDYIVSYENNINASNSAVVKITAVENSNYQGSKEITFIINKRTLNISYVENIEVQSYTANEIRPTVSIKYNGTTLVEIVDYSLEYSNNTNVGTANVSINGMGNFDGSIIKQFSINPTSISNAQVQGLESSYIFTSSAIRPILTVIMNNKTLELGVDYTIDYSEDSINVGNKTIVITGINNYKENKTLSYSITPKNIGDSDIEVLGIVDKDYDKGNAITQEFSFKFLGNTIYSADSYTCVYSNNITAGVSTITVSGKNNYNGTRIINFNIKKLATEAYVTCADAIIYEGNLINLNLTSSSVPGKILTQLSSYVAGEYTYTWIFVPNDETNYNATSGTITLNAIALEIIGLSFDGQYKTEYSAYDAFDITNLAVYLEYNSGKKVLLTNNKYAFNINAGTLLKIGDRVLVTYSLDTNIKEYLPIMISPRILTISSFYPQEIVANGEKQYLDIQFVNAVGAYPVQYIINYFNITNNSSNDYILERGKYRIEINILDSNYMLENNNLELEVYSKTLNSTDNNFTIESSEGFGLDERFNCNIVADESLALQESEMQSFGVEGKFIELFKLNLTTNKNISIKFNPNISNVTKLKVYKLSEGKLVQLSYNVLENGFVSINCNGQDRLYLFEESNNMSNAGFDWITIVIIAVLFAITIGVVFIAINRKQKHQRVLNNNQSNSINNNDKLKNSNNTKDYPNDNHVNTDGAKFIPSNTSVATSHQPSDTNISKNDSSNTISAKEIIKKYTICDENGRIVGLREGAPERLKQAFEKFKQDRQDK